VEVLANSSSKAILTCGPPNVGYVRQALVPRLSLREQDGVHPEVRRKAGDVAAR
jgi:hypothetical protein